MTTKVAIHPTVDRLHPITDGLTSHWFLLFSLFFSVYVGLPFLAPILMHLGWERPAKAIYLLYTFLCHQLSERSLFFFGKKIMYSLGEIQAAWQTTLNPIVLRQFIGNPSMGWKMAWSDRMVAMYGSILVFGLLWWPFRRRISSLPWWGFLLLLLPIALDGTTHLISDLWGIEQGFRQTNLWLAELTRYAFPTNFYTGNALGSFNSWMRWVSGSLFGLGVVWFGFPYLDEAFNPGES
jgi:uncharacterized membrane protein